MTGLMPLAPLVRAYLSALDLMAIYVTADGAIAVGCDPGRAGAVAAWWVADRRTAEAIALRAADSSKRPGDAVVSAADELGVPLTGHARVVARAEARLEELDRPALKSLPIEPYVFADVDVE